MADTKISALPAAASFLLPNESAVNEAGTSKKVTGTQIQTAMFKNPTFAAGSATLAAYTLVTGAVLTNALAGVVEYDGVCFYTTPVASARGLSPSMMYSIVAAGDFALATSVTTQAAFAAAGDTWTLAGTTAYWFDGLYYITKSGTTTTVGMGFSGTATVTNILYYAIATNGAANTTSATQATMICTTSANTVIGTTSVTALHIRFSGILQVNGAGTIIPNVAWSASNTAPTMKAGSHITFTPLGTNTATVLGNVG